MVTRDLHNPQHPIHRETSKAIISKSIKVLIMLDISKDVATPIRLRLSGLCRQRGMQPGLLATSLPRQSSHAFAGLIMGFLIAIMPSTAAWAQPQLMPHRPLLRGFGGLCDGGPVPCVHVDQIAFNVGADAIVLPSTSLRSLGFVTPYGFSIGVLKHLEGGIFSHTAVWGQPSQTDAGQTNTLWQQGPVLLALKGVVWPLVGPQQRFAVLVDFEYEARLPHFDGQNQLGLLTDLGTVRAVANLPLGLAELGVSAGALFDWQGRYGTAEVGARVGLHLPFSPDVKVFAEGLARGFASRIQTDPTAGPLPGAVDPTRPIVPSGALGFGIISRTKRQVDFSMIVHVGFGDVAPFFLTLRFADVAWGEGYPRPQSIVVDAIREFAAWVREQVASIDPIFSDTCLMLDDAPSGQVGKSLDLLGHRTQDRRHCIWNGLWLRADQHYWKNKRGTLLCYDQARNHCFAERASTKERWHPLENPAHTALLRGDCVFEDADTKHRLTHFGTLTRDGRSCTDGSTAFEVGQHAPYNPELHQIDRGTQGTARQHPPLEYEGELTTLQRLHTALGRGIEAGQQENRDAEEQTKAQAAAGDKQIDAALKKVEHMTPASIVDGVAAAEREAEADLRHAGADPKGTFNAALAQIRQGVENTAGAVKDGAVNTAQQIKQGVQNNAQDAYDWSKKPVVDKAEDLLKLGGRKAATAPRDVTKTVATGVATVVAGKVVGGAVLEGMAERKAAQQLLHEAEKKAESTPYGHLPPPRKVAPGKAPSAAQKERIRAANMKANDGKLIDDYTGQELVPPAKSQKGVVPPPNEAQVDHRIPASRGGDNSYENLRLTSRQHNRRKSNRMPNDKEH